MHRYFVTGTDTDVGKTRTTAALALALRLAGRNPTVVKAVQTGLTPDVDGDAARAGRLAGAPFRELVRFERAADPWSAARAVGAPELRARDLAGALDAIPGTVVVEGAGGFLVPLNQTEDLGEVAALARLEIVVAVGLRLGCINHALLTLRVCRELRVRVAGVVLIERWSPVDDEYYGDVQSVLYDQVRLFGRLPFSPDERASVRAGAALFDQLIRASYPGSVAEKGEA